jgi:hypothetical protein
MRKTHEFLPTNSFKEPVKLYQAGQAVHNTKMRRPPTCDASKARGRNAIGRPRPHLLFQLNPRIPHRISGRVKPGLTRLTIDLHKATLAIARQLIPTGGHIGLPHFTHRAAHAGAAGHQTQSDDEHEERDILHSSFSFQYLPISVAKPYAAENYMLL